VLLTVAFLDSLLSIRGVHVMLADVYFLLLALNRHFKQTRTTTGYTY